MFNNPTPVVFPCQRQLLGGVHAAVNCLVSVALGEDSSHATELPGEAQPGNAEVTCLSYPVPGQHSCPLHQLFISYKAGISGFEVCWAPTAMELFCADLHTSKQVTTSSPGHWNSWTQKKTPEPRNTLTWLYWHAYFQMSWVYALHSPQCQDFIVLGTRWAKWRGVLGTEANQPSFAPGLCVLHSCGPSTVTQPSRALKDRNSLSLHPVPAPKGTIGCEDGRTVRDGFSLNAIKSINCAPALLWATLV